MYIDYLLREQDGQMLTGGVPVVVYLLVWFPLMLIGTSLAYAAVKFCKNKIVKLGFVTGQVVLVIFATMFIELTYMARAGVGSL